MYKNPIVSVLLLWFLSSSKKPKQNVCLVAAILLHGVFM